MARADNRSNEKHVGPVLKRLRTRSGLSLRMLAAKVGFSASFLSQLEKAQVSPSIASLDRIARALGVTIVDLLQSAQGQTGDGLVRGSARPAFNSSWSRARIESLSPSAEGLGLEALMITLAPSGTSGGHSTDHPHQQFAYLLKGTLTLFMGDDPLELKAGDAVTIAARKLHRWQNTGRRPAQLLLVVNRQSLGTSLR
jgi:transcriptional regulator with XRE-family HTH domain